MSSKPPTGPSNGIAIVGEAPGFTETLIGEPFVGPSGKLLGEVLSRYGIEKDHCFQTNVVLCRPDGNADPSQDAIKSCKPRLFAEIEGYERLLTLGNVAAKALFGGTDGILKRRVGPAKPTTYPSGNGATAVATIHPAAVLRSADFFPYLVSDIGKLTQEVRTWIEPQYKVADTERKALRYIEFLKCISNVSSKNLAIDIETAFEKDLAYERPEHYDLLCVGIAYDSTHAIVFTGDVLGNRTIARRLGQLLASSNLIAQNGKFDIPALKIFGDCRLAADTMLASYCLDERGGIHALDTLGQEWLGTPNWKNLVKQYTKGGRSFASIPSDILYKYNAYDCAITYALHEMFESKLRAASLGDLHAMLVRASNALMEVESAGIKVDLDKLDELDTRYAAQLAAREETLSQWVNNPRSPKQVTAALAARGVTTASTDVSHLQQIREAVDPYIASHDQAASVARFIDKLLEYRSENLLHRTYIKGVRKRLYHGRVYPTYLLHGTVTGRLSCRNPNVQNIPVRTEMGREMREMYVADEGNVFIQLDYAQGESRILSLLAGIERWRQMFAEGVSPLKELAKQLFGPRYNKHQYTRCKNLVYGGSYGMILGRGPQGKKYARDTMKMSNDEAYAFQMKYFEAVPEIPVWQEATRHRVLSGETLTTFTGRRRHFWYISEENKKDVLNECLAFVPQSTLSDICLLGLCELIERGYQVRLTIHDAVVLEAPVDQAERIANEASEILMESGRHYTTAIPFPVEWGIGRSWATAGDT